MQPTPAFEHHRQMAGLAYEHESIIGGRAAWFSHGVSPYTCLMTPVTTAVPSPGAIDGAVEEA